MVSLVSRGILLCFAMALALAGQCGLSQQFITPRNVTPGPSTNSTGWNIYGGPDNPGNSPGDAFLPSIAGIADFNGDYKPDVLTSYNPAGTVTSGTPSFALLINNGDGTFTRKVLTNVFYPSARTANVSVRVADINGDGKPDLVTIIGGGEDSNLFPIGPATLHAYLGNGDGTFRALAPQVVAAKMDASIMAAADLNGDGKADLLLDIYNAGTGEEANQILLNNGSSVFLPGGSLPPNEVFPNILAADIYGQKHLDLVVPGEILKNDGAANFTLGATIPYGEITAIGDVNHDGRNDLFIVEDFNTVAQPTSTYVLLNRGGANFTQSAVLGNVTFNGLVMDLNGDGLADLFAAGGGGLMLFPGKGDGTFSAPTSFSLASSYAVADFDDDGKPDILTSETAPFMLAKGDGHGSFSAPRVTITGQSARGPEAIAAGDFNGDGRPDIAVVNTFECYSTGRGSSGPFVCPPARISISPGTGQGYQGPVRYLPVGVTAGVMAVGDVNNDGMMDIVVVRAANLPVVEEGRTFDTSVLLGKGDGTFQTSKNYRLLGFPGSGLLSAADAAVYLLDVNKDGKLDLVGDWGVALGKGDGSFQAPIPLPTGVNTITGVVAGDFNHDGKVDLVVGSFDQSSQNQTLKTLIGDGKGSFTITHTTSFSVAGYPQGQILSIAVADLNGDGVLDLIYSGVKYNQATGTNNGYGLYVQVCNGNGTFATPTKVAAFPAFNIVTGDFNRDGHIDVLIGGLGTEGDLALYKGVGNGTLASVPQWLTAGSTNNGGISLLTVNLNSDSAPDVVNLAFYGYERLLNTGAH